MDTITPTGESDLDANGLSSVSAIYQYIVSTPTHLPNYLTTTPYFRTYRHSTRQQLMFSSRMGTATTRAICISESHHYSNEFPFSIEEASTEKGNWFDEWCDSLVNDSSEDGNSHQNEIRVRNKVHTLSTCSNIYIPNASTRADFPGES